MISSSQTPKNQVLQTTLSGADLALTFPVG
jgi:hypothetical protein